MTVKEEVIKELEKMPDDSSMEDIGYKLYVIGKVQNAEDDIKNGNTLTVEELEKEMEAW